MLVANNPKDLQKLLTICTDWANTWKLQFSATKSKTLTNNQKAIPPMQLQGKNVYETDVRNYSYKYLGLPITSKGINEILQKNKTKFNTLNM